MKRIVWMLMLAASCGLAQEWKPLFDGKTIDGWESVGDGFWTFMSDGTLLGERRPSKSEPAAGSATFTRREYNTWRDTQAWLYTKREDFGEFDLHLEFWTRTMGNSGVSLRDPSRGKWSVSNPPDFSKTPSKIGYEIQINNQYPDPHPTGSIYGFVDAKTGVQKDNDWNSMDIESRNEGIRVKVNGVVVAEHPGDPNRAKVGPIGLQLHDQFSVIMFRNVKIRELAGRR